jgi:hypothetical protein
MTHTSPVKNLSRLFWAFALCVAGCASRGDPQTTGGDPDGSSGDLAVAGCTNLVPSDVIVGPTGSGMAQAPSPGGGALVAGTYHLVTTIYYPGGGCSAVGVATSLRVSLGSANSGSLETATKTDAGDVVSESVSFVIAGTSLSVHLDCVIPDAVGVQGSVAQIPYSATPTDVQLYRSTPDCGAGIDTYQLD